VGRVLEIQFPTFTPRVTIRSERELTVEIISGNHDGFTDTVEYEAVAVRDDLVMLSWQEHIGSTIVHMLDFGAGSAYTAVTPAKGGFMRLKGRIDVKYGICRRQPAVGDSGGRPSRTYAALGSRMVKQRVWRKFFWSSKRPLDAIRTLTIEPSLQSRRAL
jgi:hypothetical protein